MSRTTMQHAAVETGVTGVPRPAVRPRGWWARHWKWVVPVSVAVVAALFIGFVALIFAGVRGMVRSTDVYATAMAETRSSMQVLAALGTPIEEGMLFAGSIEVTPSAGAADLAIPVEGPGGRATVIVVAEKSGGEWYYDTLEVRVRETGETIDLLAGR